MSQLFQHRCRQTIVSSLSFSKPIIPSHSSSPVTRTRRTICCLTYTLLLYQTPTTLDIRQTGPGPHVTAPILQRLVLALHSTLDTESFCPHPTLAISSESIDTESVGEISWVLETTTDSACVPSCLRARSDFSASRREQWLRGGMRALKWRLVERSNWTAGMARCERMTSWISVGSY